MNFLQRCAISLGACLLMGNALADTITLSDAKYNTSVQVSGTRLKLNGAGVRYKAVFKVYAAALYLETKADNMRDVVDMKGPKRMVVTVLREVDSNELGKLFLRGIEDNMDRASFNKLLPGMVRMSQIFSNYKRLETGQQFIIDWIPGTGMVITVKGEVQEATFKEPAFFEALMGIWLGDSPADWKLKDALLGKPA